jgi:8-oxo-dGTP pyrophosphatase MutT (NUDIX family)
MPSAPRIRPIALAIIRRGDDLLVYEGFDKTTGQAFHRPLGGGIEFQEPAIDAVRRELIEELGAELADVEPMAVRENIFEVNGRPGHEIVFYFSASLVDPSFYMRDDVGVILDEGSPVSWQPLRRFEAGQATLRPVGLLELLRDRERTRPAGPPG